MQLGALLQLVAMVVLLLQQHHQGGGVQAAAVNATGYLCDVYCWELPRSVALDGARMAEAPERHTVHCMRDVARCRDSGFVLLQQLGSPASWAPT